MRLLIDAHHLGRRETGNETWLRNMIPSIERLAHPDEICCATTASGLDEVGNLTSAPVELLSCSRVRRLAVDLPRLARSLAAGAILATWTTPVTTCPCVLLVHDLSLFRREAGGWARPGARLRHRMAVAASCRRAAHVIVPSNYTRSELLERLQVPAERVSVVPGAPDSELASRVSRPSRRQPTGEFTVLCVGNVLARKNLTIVAQAVRANIDRGRRMRLRVVGQIPPEGHRVARELRLILGDSLHLTGYLSRADLAGEYSRAEVLCFPSHYEGFGLPVVEAMAAGTPVVASRATSLPEVAGHAALLVSPTELADWTDALALLYFSADWRKRLADSGVERAAAYSWDRSAAQVLHLLRRAAGHRLAEGHPPGYVPGFSD